MSRHPTGRDAFAACDLHLPDLLRKAHGSTITKRWRVSHLEIADPQFMCVCQVPGHWFFLEVPTE